jgi:hypothetical protein
MRLKYLMPDEIIEPHKFGDYIRGSDTENKCKLD